MWETRPKSKTNVSFEERRQNNNMDISDRASSHVVARAMLCDTPHAKRSFLTRRGLRIHPETNMYHPLPLPILVTFLTRKHNFQKMAINKTTGWRRGTWKMCHSWVWKRVNRGVKSDGFVQRVSTFWSIQVEEEGRFVEEVATKGWYKRLEKGRGRTTPN